MFLSSSVFIPSSFNPKFLSVPHNPSNFLSIDRQVQSLTSSSMDCEPEELQFLGIICIYREASKLIVSWRRLFTQISVSLIVPLSLILVNIDISYVFFDCNEYALKHTASGFPSQTRLLYRLSSEWSAFLSKFIYHHALLVFSLLSTAAVVPKAWRRLALTFLFGFLFLASYNFIAIIVLVLTILIAGENVIGIVMILFLSLAYLVGLVWISVVWHLASVVSVLEEDYGLAALRRSKDLVKGKMRIATTMFLKLKLTFIAIELLFRRVVMVGEVSISVRVVFATAMLGFMSAVVLFTLVAQTVLYFVCKSYHHDSIDKSALADHLEVCLGEYLPLKEKDVQMEQVNV
ncbi:hypothetical protein M5K25_000616 [Dendrobium thyrsiflorum]|uniref:Uncharacterized protein n=1 Tax=Dendrobium thyrsiflorum TaxID=117978 RepID=A0ABD0W7N2_DENTH